MINEYIPFQKMFVLDQNGEKLGMMTKHVAIERAKSSGYDLVIISDNTQQPVAKILDYGKFKYLKKKKTRDAKSKQAVVENREVRITTMIGEHDLMVKSRKAREFILNGDRVKVSLKFRGREIVRKDLGFDKLKHFFETVSDIAKIEKEPALFGGKFLDMYLTRDRSKGIVETTKVKEENENDKSQKS